MNRRQRIGILAGMGPRSTAPFLELVYDECQMQYGAKNDIDFPEIVVFSWPTPFYIDKKFNDDELYYSIKTGLIELEKNQVDITAIPCNIAHVYYEKLVKDSKSRLLNIVDITTDKIPDDSNKITILATQTTMEMNLYQNRILKKGKKYYFDEDWQSKVNNIIGDIKNKKDYSVIEKKYVELEREIKNSGVDTVIFACTDLSVIGVKKQRELRIIDSSKELAKRLIQEYLKDYYN
jgi:aspartate racemase